MLKDTPGRAGRYLDGKNHHGSVEKAVTRYIIASNRDWIISTLYCQMVLMPLV